MYKLIMIYILILLSSVPCYAMLGQGNIVVHKTITVNEDKTDLKNTAQGVNEGTKKTTEEANAAIVNKLLAGNRDFKKSQEITTDQTLGGIGASLTVQNETLTKPVEYFKESLDALTGLPKNLGLAGKRIGDAVGDVGNVAANTVNGRISIGEAVDLVGNVKIGKLRDQKEAENKNNEIADSVNNLLGGNAESARETLKNEVNSTTSTLGGSNTNADGSKRETYVYDEIDPNSNNQMQTPEGQIINKNEAAAITETNSKDIGFDMRNPDLQNGVEVEKITTHEASHRAGYGEGASSLLGDVAADVWQKGNAANGRTTNTSSDPILTQSNWLANQQLNPANAAILQQGDEWIGNVQEGETLPANQLINDAKISSGFSLNRIHPKTGKITKHTGVDLITFSNDKTILSAADGTVIKSGYQYNSKSKTGWGNYILIDNGNGYETRYAHMQSLPSLKKGAEVKEGEILGLVGATGGVTGPHLHFELIKSGNYVNPQNSDGSYMNIGNFNTRKELQNNNVQKSNKK